MYVHFLEEVSIGDDFQLLQDEIYSTLNEERLVFLESVVQLQQVTGTETTNTKSGM